MSTWGMFFCSLCVYVCVSWYPGLALFGVERLLNFSTSFLGLGRIWVPKPLGWCSRQSCDNQVSCPTSSRRWAFALYRNSVCFIDLSPCDSQPLCCWAGCRELCLGSAASTLAVSACLHCRWLLLQVSCLVSVLPWEPLAEDYRNELQTFLVLCFLGFWTVMLT